MHTSMDQREYQKKYNADYYLKNKLTLNTAGRDYVDDVNRKILELLGTECSVCNEDEYEFLTVDHVNSDRKTERASCSLTWKRDILAGRVDLSKYQILCRNCNEAKQRLNPINLTKERVLTGQVKTCSICGQEKDLCFFSTSSYRNKTGIIRTFDASCNICTRFVLLNVTIKCYELLGGSCKCCGISEPCKLNIDHVHNDGAERRRNGEPTGANLCRQILNGKRILENYQLLCANCNYSKLRRGVCLHRVAA